MHVVFWVPARFKIRPFQKVNPLTFINIIRVIKGTVWSSGKYSAAATMSGYNQLIHDGDGTGRTKPGHAQSSRHQFQGEIRGVGTPSSPHLPHEASWHQQSAESSGLQPLPQTLPSQAVPYKVPTVDEVVSHTSNAGRVPSSQLPTPEGDLSTYAIPKELIRVRTGGSILETDSVIGQFGRSYHGYKEGKYLLPNDFVRIPPPTICCYVPF